jgi:hypothetical protein
MPARALCEPPTSGPSPSPMTDLNKAKQVRDSLERAAEAAHDAYYNVTAGTSDLAYVFEDERTKDAWREVAFAVVRSL